MSKNPRISIIVSVYNTEKYLDKCLNSIVNQTLKDIEILIVNDCSPDNSDKIIKKYQKKDKRIKYIKHKKNLGLGGAWNTGIKNASGKYIGFVDSDDWIKPEMYETMYSKAEEKKCDVVVGGILHVEENSKTSKIGLSFNKEYLFIGKKAFNLYMKDFKERYIKAFMWNKLYKRDIFIKNNLTFLTKINHQDLAIMPQVLFFSSRVALIPGEYYFHQGRKGAAGRTLKMKNIQGSYQMFKETKSFLKTQGIFGKYKEDFYRLYFFHHALYKTFKNRILRLSKNEKERKFYTKKLLKLLLKEVNLDEIVEILDKEDLNCFMNFLSNMDNLHHNLKNFRLTKTPAPIKKSPPKTKKFILSKLKMIIKKIKKGVKAYFFFPVYIYKTYAKNKKVEKLIKNNTKNLNSLSTQFKHLKDNFSTSPISKDQILVKVPKKLDPVPHVLKEKHVKHCEVLARRRLILDKLPKNLVVAEVGVQFGDFTKSILKQMSPTKFYAIDLFNFHKSKKVWRSPKINNFYKNKTSIQYYKDRFAQEIEKGQLFIKQGVSWEVLNSFPDNYFDFIYIDAGHDYKSVKKDSEVAIKKLKKGGFLGFNDYMLFSTHTNKYYGIVQVVNSLCVERNYEILYFSFHFKMNCDVILRKIQK